MSDNITFIGGLIAKAPHEKAPEYVKAKLSIKRKELIDWLIEQGGEWINAEIKEGRSGKWYCAVDDWKPNKAGDSSPAQSRPQTARKPQQDYFADDDDIPF